MRILAFDTALAACSVAFVRDDRPVAYQSRALERGHAEALMPMIEAVRAEAGFVFGEVDAFAVTVGPGTFAGIRVGLAAARAFALTTGRPAIGVSTLSVLRRTAAERGPENDAGHVVAAIDAKRDEVYIEIAPLAASTALVPACLVGLDRVPALVPDGAVVVCGSGAVRLAPLLSGKGRRVAIVDGYDQTPLQPDPVALAALAAAEIATHGAERFRQPPRPLYLRAPDARLPGPRS
jgi:tRNA threonylcarbamoyladenosine biosynthesis protein TsaB